MSLQIRTNIGGELYFLDLYQDEPLLFNFSFAEIQDITQKNSAFSQTFNLPGTKKNNRIFDYYYEVTALPTNFDPNKKFPAIITWDGLEILQGNIRLENVTISNGEIIYSVTFYNQIGDLAANIGDKFLIDTNLNHLSHPYSSDVITQSQYDPYLFNITGNTNYSYQNGKTFWGLYNIGYNYFSGDSVNFYQTPLVYFTPASGGTYTPLLGYFDNSGTPVWDYYFKPTIQIKELYETICKDAGYEVESNFFKTAYFERYYLPLKFLDETPYTKSAIEACFTISAQTILNSSPFGNDVLISGKTTCNTLNWPTTSNSYTIPTNFPGNYTFKYSFDVIPTSDCNVPITVPTFFLVQNGNTIYSDQLCNLSGVPRNYVVNYNVNTTGGTFQTYFIFSDCYVTGFTQSLVAPIPRYLVSGQTIDYAIEFPPNDYKQIDFITSVNRYFNLVCVPSPDNPKKIIVEPMIDYIGKGQVLDWTTKVDRGSDIQITPTTSLINGTLEFDFKLDQDWANNQFKQAANRVFGTERKQLNIDFKDNVIKFDSIFSSPLDITINPAQAQYATLPSFSKVNQRDNSGAVEQQFVPFKILPRVLFRGPVMSRETYGAISGATGGYQDWYLKAAGSGFTMNHFQEVNRFTTYPWNYNNFSHYTNWRGEDRTTITPLEDTFIAEDLYDIYYDDYIEDLISKENKIISCKIYLKPYEIKNLRFDEKVLIDNNYYRINKISNYNLLEPSLCSVELIKLTKEYEGHRKIHYRFDPCTAPGDTLWSNSDLMYNAYAYAERYVKLYDENLNYIDCYQVFVDTSGLGEQFGEKKYYFGTAFTNNSIGVYEDCGCTGSTSMIVVQQLPSPTPTPTNTPTPSVTPCVNCYEYSFTANTSGLLTWRDCDGITTDTFLNNGDTYTITCPGAREGTPSGNGTLVKGNLCFSSCITPTPTTTPTRTPITTSTPSTTPSVTQTPTPSSTFGLSPTPTPSFTSTPQPTQTQTGTPQPTQTQTGTPSISPTPSATNPGGQLTIYGKYINSGQEVGYTINSGTYIGIGVPGTSCDLLTTITGLQINDVIDFMTISTCAIGGSLTDCPSGTSSCNYQHTFNGNTSIYLTIDASSCC